MADTSVAQDRSFGGFNFCVRPARPVCIDGSMRTRDDCRADVQAFLDQIVRYRVCMMATVADTMTDVNAALDHVRCDSVGQGGCPAPQAVVRSPLRQTLSEGERTRAQVRRVDSSSALRR